MEIATNYFDGNIFLITVEGVYFVDLLRPVRNAIQYETVGGGIINNRKPDGDREASTHELVPWAHTIGQAAARGILPFRTL